MRRLRRPRRSARRCWPLPRRLVRLRLADLMRQTAAPAGWRGAAPLEVAGITADSRRVLPGYVFAALPGRDADGRAFIAEAVARGAVAVLAPDGTQWPPGVPPRPL